MSIFCYKNELLTTGVVLTDITATTLVAPLAGTVVTPSFGKPHAPFIVQANPLTQAAHLEITFPVATIIDTIVYGANAYLPFGYKVLGTSVTVSYLDVLTGLYVALPAHVFTSPQNANEYVKYVTPISTTSLRLVFNGLPLGVSASIPELFMGTGYTISSPDYGVDLNGINSHTLRKDSENGAVYETLLYSRLEVTPSWSFLNDAEYLIMKAMALHIATTRDPFYAILVDNELASCYMFRLTDGTIPITRVSNGIFSMSMNLVEAV